MGTCWSGFFSSLRTGHQCRDQDGFLIEMNSMDFNGIDKADDDKKTQNRNEKIGGNSVTQNQFPTRQYFTLDDSTPSNSCTSVSDLRMEECEESSGGRKPNYREILDPQALKFFFNKHTFRKLSGEEVNSNLQESKPGSVVSVDLEWEHEGCISMYEDEGPDPKLNLKESSSISATQEENGNLTYPRWKSNLQHSVSQTSNVTDGSSCYNIPNDKSSKTRASSGSSLAWDGVNNHQMYGFEDCSGIFDHEAEQLISEIDALTSRALRETGTWTNSSTENLTLAASSSFQMTDNSALMTGTRGKSQDSLSHHCSAFSQSFVDASGASGDLTNLVEEKTTSSRQSDAMISSLDTDSSL